MQDRHAVRPIQHSFLRAIRQMDEGKFAVHQIRYRQVLNPEFM